jgi:hypothetical protein
MKCKIIVGAESDAVMHKPGHHEFNCCRMFRRGWNIVPKKGGTFRFEAKMIGCSVDYWFLVIPWVADEIFAELKRRIG